MRHKDNVELAFLNCDFVRTWFMVDLSEIYWSFRCLSEKKHIIITPYVETQFFYIWI